MLTVVHRPLRRAELPAAEAGCAEEAFGDGCGGVQNSQRSERPRRGTGSAGKCRAARRNETQSPGWTPQGARP